MVLVIQQRSMPVTETANIQLPVVAVRRVRSAAIIAAQLKNKPGSPYVIADPKPLSNDSTGWDLQLFSTGIGRIDKHHQALFQLVANLRTCAHRSKESPEIRHNQMVLVSEQIAALEQYAALHFVFEESLFTDLAVDKSEVGGLSLQSQCHEHDEFVGFINAEFMRFSQMVEFDISVIEELLCYTSNWLISHIKMHDIPELTALVNGRAIDFEGCLIAL